MRVELQWQPSASASCFHAAEQLSRGAALVDEPLMLALERPALQLQEFLDTATIPIDLFWEHVVPLAAGIGSNSELASVVVAKSCGRGSLAPATVETLAGCISDFEAAWENALPNIAKQLVTRSEKLQSAWEARGPGMMARIGELTDDNLVVSNATVILVYPSGGGDGAAHLPYNSVRIEAMLTNPNESLPEPVRLAWLISQLNLDVPIYSEKINGRKLDWLAGLAMLPAVLEAGQWTELVQDPRVAVPMALAEWEIVADNHDEVAGVLLQWWDTYQASRPSWGVAFEALDRMTDDLIKAIPVE